MFESLPVWGMGILIFGLRVIDVCLGTIRTISVVHGRRGVAVVLGFVEVTIWVVAVTQVVSGIGDHPALVFAFAGGFATGNAVGIALEQWLALGQVVVRIITRNGEATMEAALSGAATGVASFPGHAIDGTRTLSYASCRRRNLNRLLARAREADPELFFVVERFSQIGAGPLPHPTGWRAIFKKK